MFCWSAPDPTQDAKALGYLEYYSGVSSTKVLGVYTEHWIYRQLYGMKRPKEEYGWISVECLHRPPAQQVKDKEGAPDHVRTTQAEKEQQ